MTPVFHGLTVESAAEPSSEAPDTRPARRAMRRPLPAVFAAFAVGVWWGLRVPDAPGAALAGASVALALFAVLHAAALRGCVGVKRWARLAALFLAICASGRAVAVCSDAGRVMAWHAARAEGLRGRVVLTGMAIETPRLDPRTKTVRVFTLRTARIAFDAHGEVLDVRIPVRVRCRGYRTEPPFRAGDRLSVAGRLKCSARGVFNPLALTLECGARSVELGEISPSGGWLRRLEGWRDALAGRLADGIESHALVVGVLRTLMLGYRDGIDGETRDVFVRTGTLHVFAISGLHVGMVALLLTTAFGILGVSRVHWAAGVIPLLCIYTLMTGARPSAVRACIMASAYFAGPMLGRRADTLSALAAAGLAILAWSPAELLGVGFILSFSVVAGLIVLYPPIERCLARGASRVAAAAGWGGARADGLVPAPVGRAAFWRRLARGLGDRALATAGLSLCAWLVTLPLNAYYFGTFVPVALIGNLVVVPLTFLVVLTGCLSMVSGCLFVSVSQVFNHTNLALVSAMLSATGFLADVPGGCVTVDRLPGWAVWAAFGGMALVAAWGRRTWSERGPESDRFKRG